MIGPGLALVLGTLAPSQVQQAARDTADPVIVELALGRIATRTVSGYRSGDVLLVAATDFLELAQVRIVTATDSTVEAIIEPGRVAFTVDLRTARIVVGHRRMAFNPTVGASRAGRLYLATDLLGRAWDLQWRVDWGDLTATVIDPSTLPIAQRLVRDWQRRAQRGTDLTTIAAERTIPSDRSTVDGMVVDYSLFTPTGARLADGAYATSVGLDVLGGSLTTTIQTQLTSGRRGVRQDAAWAGVWRDQTWLTQLRLGDGLATGPRPRTIRGISFGNSPYIRPNALGEATFAGDLGPGWQVEAYRGGRLIAFDSVNALGRYAIDAPIAYGENPIELVAYGPFGEVRRFNRTYRVDPNRLPRGHFEYGAALGGCRTERCDATANLDLRYGLSSHWTVQGGFDHFWRPDSLGALFHPYLSIAGTVGNAVGLQVDGVANAVFRGSLRYEPATSLVITAEATRFARGVRDPILTPGGRTSQVTLSGIYYPLPRMGAFFLEGSLDVVRTEITSTTGGRLGLSYQYRQVQLLPSVRWQGPQTSFVLNAYALPTPSLGPVLGQISGRLAIETAATLDPWTLTGYLSRNLGREIRVEVGGGWTRFQGAVASVQIAANLASVRSLTSLTTNGSGTVGSQFVQGSVLYNRQSRRVGFAAGPSLERAGLTGRVFLDRNGNERFDPGEDLLPNVRVIVGMETRVSNHQGEYRLWNVTPHEPALIAVDSTTLESPLWVPAFSAIQVEPGPNRYRVVDLPVVPGGVLDGRVVNAADSVGLAGVSLVLTNRVTGAIRHLSSFSDGEFYLMGVKPGEYDLSVAESAPFAAVAPILVVMPANPDGGAVTGLVVRLTRR